jgi:hypothetical protein
VTISLIRVEQTPSGRRLRACQETIATPASSESDATTSGARFGLDIRCSQATPTSLVSRRLRRRPDQRATLTPPFFEAT